MEHQAIISELVGEAYPPVVALDGGRLRRNWIARTVNALPDNATLSEMAKALEEDAFTRIATAYSSAATPEELSRARASVCLLRLDDHHLVVRIEFAGPEHSVGDAAAISQWGVLEAIDRQIRLDELQGLPCDHWFPLRAGREARTAGKRGQSLRHP
jgi:hypothetical protein